MIRRLQHGTEGQSNHVTQQMGNAAKMCSLHMVRARVPERITAMQVGAPEEDLRAAAGLLEECTGHCQLNMAGQECEGSHASDAADVRTQEAQEGLCEPGLVSTSDKGASSSISASSSVTILQPAAHHPVCLQSSGHPAPS
jgi:hypothetical protein